MKNPLNSTSLERLYNKALKQAGKPIKSSVAPILNNKRRHTADNSDGESSEDKFSEPRKVIKTAKLNRSASQISLISENKYDALSDEDMTEFIDENKSQEFAEFMETSSNEVKQNYDNNEQRYHSNDNKQRLLGTSAGAATKRTCGSLPKQQIGKQTSGERDPLITVTNANFKEVINLLNPKLEKNEFYKFYKNQFIQIILMLLK